MEQIWKALWRYSERQIQHIPDETGTRPGGSRENYAMKIVARGKYEAYAKLFHLEERYEYHKGEALRLLDLKRKYPASNLKKIAKMLHKTKDEVHEDIFGLGYSKDNHRCFDKMKRDIM